MSLKYLQELEEDLKSVEKDLSLMQNVLKEAKKQKELADKYSAMHDLYDSIKDQVSYMKSKKTKLAKKIEKLINIQPNKQVKFMFFKAGHRQFRSDEIKFMAQSLRKFGDEEIFELENVDFQMSDYATLYATEKLSDDEAQFMWEYYWQNQCDDDLQERYNHGDLMYWNGKELTDENGIPLIK